MTMSTTYTTDLPPVGTYRPHRPQIMWATPIATAPDPYHVMLQRLRDSNAQRNPTEQKSEKRRPTTIKWADPIASIADEMAGFAQRVELDDPLPEKNIHERHVAWANPIATVTEDVCAEGMRRRVKMVGGEKVLLSRKRIMNGKVVVGATEQLASASFDPMMDLEDAACASRRAMPVAVEDPGKASSPIVTVREVDVEPTGRLRRFIRRWKLKLGWMCDFDEKPLTEEEMCLLQQEDGAKKHPSRAPPCWAYSLACGFCVLVLGVFAWVFRF